jgi:DNA-binding winged helix-turn-helix (wHTH) protein
MGDAQTRRPIYRFANFELDTRPGELRKQGMCIRLQDQPLQILFLLLEHAGELVSREKIRNRLWPDGTFVDYDNAINTAMRKLREALGDDSGGLQLIETFSRRGYRFNGKIEGPTGVEKPEPPPKGSRKSRGAIIATFCGGVLIVAAVARLWLWPHLAVETNALQMRPVPLTAAPGIEADASFSPDGNEVAYSWDEGENDVSHIYVKLIGSATALRLTAGATKDGAPAWSPDGRNLAFLRHQVRDVSGPASCTWCLR